MEPQLVISVAIINSYTFSIYFVIHSFFVNVTAKSMEPLESRSKTLKIWSTSTEAFFSGIIMEYMLITFDLYNFPSGQSAWKTLKVAFFHLIISLKHHLTYTTQKSLQYQNVCFLTKIFVFSCLTHYIPLSFSSFFALIFCFHFCEAFYYSLQ